MGKSGDSKDRSGARWDGRHRSGISKGYASGSRVALLWANIAEKSVMAWCCYPRRIAGVWLIDGRASSPCLSRVFAFCLNISTTSPHPPSHPPSQCPPKRRPRSPRALLLPMPTRLYLRLSRSMDGLTSRRRRCSRLSLCIGLSQQASSTKQ